MRPRTAFVLGGGGVLGATQVGMLRGLAEADITPDLVLGTSIGALNGEGLEHLFHQQWVRREDAWYFVPSARQSRTERKRAPRAYR